MRIFDGLTKDFGRTITLSEQISSGKIFRRGKFSLPSQNLVSFPQRKFLRQYGKRYYMKKGQFNNKTSRISRMFVLYKTSYGRI